MEYSGEEVDGTLKLSDVAYKGDHDTELDLMCHHDKVYTYKPYRYVKDLKDTGIRTPYKILSSDYAHFGIS